MTCLAFFKFYIYLTCFRFANAFISVHELSFECNVSKGKEKYLVVEVILYISVPVLQKKKICQHMAMQMHCNTVGFDSFTLDMLLSKRTNCFCLILKQQAYF